MAISSADQELVRHLPQTGSGVLCTEKALAIRIRGRLLAAAGASRVPIVDWTIELKGASLDPGVI